MNRAKTGIDSIDNLLFKLSVILKILGFYLSRYNTWTRIIWCEWLITLCMELIIFGSLHILNPLTKEMIIFGDNIIWDTINSAVGPIWGLGSGFSGLVWSEKAIYERKNYNYSALLGIEWKFTSLPGWKYFNNVLKDLKCFERGV